jgi:channel protein (hemolysin III family)
MPAPLVTIQPIPGFCEPFSSLSHLLGAVAMLALTAPLLRRARGHRGRMLALGIFQARALVLLLLSGVYHLWPLHTPGRAVLQRLDHAAILFLIAGSFTPPHIILFRGWWRWGILTLVWSLAAAGMAATALFFRAIPDWLSLTFYLGLGWIGAISGIKIWLRHGFGCIRLIVAGGMAYTLGALLDFAHWPVLLPGVIGPHEVFHLAVLVGLACHWRFMYRIADGQLLAARQPAVPATCPS